MHDCSQQAAARLNGLGLPLLYCKSLSSTNTALKELASQGQAHGTCLTADFQTSGRGRMERSWQAAPNRGLLFSVLLRPHVFTGQMFVFTALAGLAVCAALDDYGFSAQLKWPNDVFLRDLKLCGMLSEINKDGSLIIGIGVNVNQKEREMAGLSGISLGMATGREYDRCELLLAMLNKLDFYYKQWQQTPFAWHSAYIERSWLLGKNVIVREGDGTLQGRALTVALDGCLVLENDGGQRLKLSHGDVSVLAVNGKYK